MVCVSYTKEVFLRRTEDTNKRIVQPIIDMGNCMVDQHWFYVSDQVIASSGYTWRGLGWMKEFEKSREELPEYFQKTRWVPDWDLTFKLEEKAKVMEKRRKSRISRTERVERVEELVCI